MGFPTQQRKKNIRSESASQTMQSNLYFQRLKRYHNVGCFVVAVASSSKWMSLLRHKMCHTFTELEHNRLLDSTFPQDKSSSLSIPNVKIVQLTKVHLLHRAF